MGASKRISEMYCQSLSKITNTKFIITRFGNVLGSNGSVIPLFRKQLENGGPITVTHKNVTRYFMTIPEASNLVLQAAQMSRGGEVFILDMGEQLKIYDLAQKLVHLSGRSIAAELGGDGIAIIEVGLRPGEKMYEELSYNKNLINSAHPKIMIAHEKAMTPQNMILFVDELEELIATQNHKGIVRCMIKEANYKTNEILRQDTITAS